MKIVQRLIHEDCRVTMLATDGAYMYRLSRNPHLIDNKSPYSGLIKELQIRGKELNELTTSGPNLMNLPSAPSQVNYKNSAVPCDLNEPANTVTSRDVIQIV